MTLKEARVKSALAKGGISEASPPKNDFIDTFKPEKAPTFLQIAEEWFEMKKAGLSNGKHIHQNWRTLETYVLPHLGDVSITEIRRRDIIAVFHPIWRAKNETATRTLNRVKEVFELACTLEIIENNPAVFSTKAAFGRVKRIVKHHSALDWERVPEFYEWIQSHDCEEDLRQMVLAMLFSAKRTREVRYVAWQDLELEQGIWASRPEHMKMRREHRIPVSQQLNTVFRNMAVFSGGGGDTANAFRTREFVPVFARPRNKSGVIDENRACREIQKFQTDITGHGLRSAFRTWARKQKCYAEDLMEQALAHAKDSLVAAYFREDLLEERRPMMQDWADYVTGGKDVQPLKIIRVKRS
jgi:integrase